MFLATTGLVELWDRDDDIVVLGPWCLRYDRRHEWTGLRCTVMSNPWADGDAVAEAEAYCGKVMSATLDGLAEHFNILHGVSHSRRYWQILVGPWLLYYVHALYDRYTTLHRALLAYPGIRTVLLNSTHHRPPIDTNEFWNQGQGEMADVFNLHIYSRLWIALGGDLTVSRTVNLPARPLGRACALSPRLARLQLNAFLKAALKKMLLTLVRIARPEILVSTEMPFTAWQWMQLIRAMALRGGLVPFPLALQCRAHPISDTMRKNFRDLPASDQFARILIESLPDNIPQVFVEGYGAFREASLKLLSAQPKVFMSATGWYGDEALKFLAAEFAQCGSSLIGVQHGGGYGTDRVNPWETHEVSVTDRWLSYGWRSSKYGEKVRPTSHLRFMPVLKRRASRTGDDLLLVTPGVPRYFCRFGSFPVGRLPEIIEWRARFVMGLPDNLRSAVLVRLATPDYYWSQRQRVIDACGQVRFDGRRRTLRQAAFYARLVVVEYPGTASLEVLSANVPAVLFWDPAWWGIRKEAEPYFDKLCKAGILWHSPEEAASKVATIYEDPWAWWEDPAVQEARRLFVNEFAHGGGNWLGSWTQALVTEVARSQGCDKHAGLAPTE